MTIDPLLAGGIAVAALALGAGVAYALVRSRSATPQSFAADTNRSAEELRAAETRAQELVDQARRDADQIVREAEMKARDESARRREELTRELDIARNEVREQER